MQKSELRLAVVIYGGASLAVYMHGATRELFHLVQASKANRKATDCAPLNATGEIYLELLQEIGARQDFRVVIDVIAGASAGAINGALLGKALAFDLSLRALTELWLAQADVDELADPAPPGWRLRTLRPLISTLARLLPSRFRDNPTTRGKFQRFLGRAWLTPPLSGRRLCEILLDGLKDMADQRRGGSLLPRGTRLDLYTSITDMAGYPTALRVSERTVASEREHAVLARFTHLAHSGGPDPADAVESKGDFASANDPGLVWAARASSSYAGAFAPFHHRELQALLDERDVQWDAQTFFDRSLKLSSGTPASEVFDPADRYFLDGGIVNNKPFSAALDALNYRAADRAVDRAIVYIEPDPLDPQADAEPVNASLFGALRAAASKIPRNQPILAELTEIAALDRQAQLNRRLVDAAQPEADELLATARDTTAADDLSALRKRVQALVATRSGVLYQAYLQRRVWRLVEALVDLWRGMLPGSRSAPAETGEHLARRMTATLNAWLATPDTLSGQSQTEAFLARLDVTYRVRRLRFLIRTLNGQVAAGAISPADEAALGAMKKLAYERLALLDQRRRPEALPGEIHGQIRQAAERLPPPREAAALLRLLGRALALNTFDAETEAQLRLGLAGLENAALAEQAMSAYAGFPLYDMILSGGGQDTGTTDPLTRVRLARISPADSTDLKPFFQGLRSKDLLSFAGFFNRRYREHDFLWGRLNGAERVVDLLRQAQPEMLTAERCTRLRSALFNAILDEEASRLSECSELIERLRGEFVEPSAAAP
ncbi:MAG: patatin-like protein [Pseudomonadota bacterium]